DTEGCAVSVDVSEDYAYLASMDAGLKIVDISNPAAPEEIGSCLTPGVAWGAAVSDNYAYVAADVCGLRVIDVSNPANPFEAGSCLTTGYMICAVAVHQNLAFVLDQINSLLVIVDITYPAFPWVVSSLPVSFDFEGPGFIECIEVVEDYLYLAAGGEGLKIIDISIPSAPYEAGLYSIPDESVNGVAVSGNYAFIAGSDGLHIVYVENPSDPYEIGFCEISDGGLDVAIYDSYAYFAAFYSGLWVVDFSDPAAPFVNGHYDTPGISFSVDCDRNLAYLADLSHFEIFDCSEAVGGVPLITVTLTPEIFPYMPLEFNIEVTNNDPEAVNFDLWTMATLPDGSEYGPLLGPLNLTYPPGFSANRDRYQAIPAGAPAGTYTYDAYAGIYPAVIWSEDHFEFDVLPDSDGDSWSAAADWICTGELFPGETSVDITVPETYTLCPPYPNPFNAEMTVEFEVPRASEISLSIFDVQGRLVDVIASGQYSPGFHRAHWNGDGFASGVYFLRMEAGNFAACRKVMLIK
ncbi:MAG: T9SS type A sorting domain-containing protein, partial [FCB group bacterium]|nr:T9SS type A sorting domain-containing protein [FCB group bacterium]